MINGNGNGNWRRYRERGITIINVGIDQRRHGKRSIILFMFVVTHINKIDIMFLIII